MTYCSEYLRDLRNVVIYTLYGIFKDNYLCLKKSEIILRTVRKVELVVVKMMRPQVAAQRIFRKLGFREELLIPDNVEDRSGEKQDLIIMTCNIKDLWNDLEHFYSDSDWQRCR